MKKAINILLRISKVLDIIVIVSSVIVFIVGLINIPFAIELIQELEAAGDSADVGSIIAFSFSISFAIIFPILGVILSAGSIANIILVNKSLVRLQTAKTKSELRGLAIGTIITGVISSDTAAVAGILMLIIKDRQL